VCGDAGKVADGEVKTHLGDPDYGIAPSGGDAMGDGSASLWSSEPIFPVTDVVATVSYYRAVLGFAHQWLWGDPPDFGGVRWGRIGVMFAQQSGPDAKVGGQWHAFFVEGIDALYQLHKRNAATICSPLEAKPWGLREYTVCDLNGHYLRFVQRGSDGSATAGRDPANRVVIVERLPTPEEYQRLVEAVGWSSNAPPDRGGRVLAGVRKGVVALDGDQVVGTGLEMGDGASLAYLRDIIVVPAWQGRGVGTRIVQALLDIIRRTDHDGMLVTLFTGQHLAEFYENLGFRGPDGGLYGMSLKIDRQLH
jgi:GNAT superfamily N-acetyltransferase